MKEMVVIMFKDNRYSKAFAEVESVLLTLDNSLKKKIPECVMKALSDNKDKKYIFNYDFNKTIYEQNISVEAKIMLSKIYKDYLCTEEEKQKWKEYDLFCTTKIEEAKKLKYKDEYLKFNKKRNIQ